MASIRIFCGDLLLPLDVDEAEPVGDLPADEEIAPQRLLFGQRLILVDRFDRQIVRHPDRVFAGLNFAVADEDPARGRRQHAGHELDQRRFARAIVADEPDDLVASYGEVDVAQRVHGAEVLLHTLEANNGLEFTRRRRHCVPIPKEPADESGPARLYIRSTGRAWQRDVLGFAGGQTNRNPKLLAGLWGAEGQAWLTTQSSKTGLDASISCRESAGNIAQTQTFRAIARRPTTP